MYSVYRVYSLYIACIVCIACIVYIACTVYIACIVCMSSKRVCPHFQAGQCERLSRRLVLISVLRMEIVTIFEPKVVAISARDTIMRKFANFVRLYYPHITIFFNQIFIIYIKGSSIIQIAII